MTTHVALLRVVAMNQLPPMTTATSVGVEQAVHPVLEAISEAERALDARMLLPSMRRQMAARVVLEKFLVKIMKELIEPHLLTGGPLQPLYDPRLYDKCVIELSTLWSSATSGYTSLPLHASFKHAVDIEGMHRAVWEANFRVHVDRFRHNLSS